MSNKVTSGLTNYELNKDNINKKYSNYKKNRHNYCDCSVHKQSDIYKKYSDYKKEYDKKENRLVIYKIIKNTTIMILIRGIIIMNIHNNIYINKNKNIILRSLFIC